MADLTRTIPLDGGRTAVIRKLNWTQLKAAAKAQSSEAFALMREMGAELVKALREDHSPDEQEKRLERMEQLQKKQARKPSQYEMATILVDGVVSIDDVEKPDVQGLDPATAETLHEAIVAFAWEVPEKNG